MPKISRREFIQGAAHVAVAGSAVTSMSNRVGATEHAATDAEGISGGLYGQNRTPLRPAQFLKLPPGAVRPSGWLRLQLDLQREGLNGRLYEISEFLDYENCGWVDPSKPAWEELTYWLRGFVDLGYVTGDERVLALSRKWIDGVLASQQQGGWFGPNNLRHALDGDPDLWPHMPMLNALQATYEFGKDERILALMARFFEFVNQCPDTTFNKSWGAVRWADGIESIYWLYNRTGDARLLDLAGRIHAKSADWTGGIASWHNVNIAQGFREPAEHWMLSGDAQYRDATYRNYETVMRMYGQFAGGGFAGDENCRPGYTDPRQGFETCGWVEFMRSFGILTRITGDPAWSDRYEHIAFNSLPAAFDPHQKGTHYVTCPNAIRLENVTPNHGQFDNTFPMLAYMPGVHQYRCCAHNYGIGWPGYAIDAWVATADNGVCASLYAPCEVTAKVGAAGAEVTIVEDTGYPFDEAIRFTVKSAAPAAFPLYLRVPAWCEGAVARVNGGIAHADQESGYLRIKREWKNGDTVDLTLPMTTRVRRWPSNQNSVSVERGPLTYSLAIDESWTRIGGTDQWPEYKVTPGSAWNVGLVVDDFEPARSFSFAQRPHTDGANPFTHDGAPVALTAKAKRIPDWQADDDGLVGLLPASPAETTPPLLSPPGRESEADVETVTLIPMGAARLRITSFPTVAPALHGG